jgi:hypothetical protein
MPEDISNAEDRRPTRVLDSQLSNFEPHSPTMSFQQPTPFTINIDDSILKLTKEKLQEARFPDELQNVGWEGAPTPSQH